MTLAAGYLIAAGVAADRLPAGTSVGGVDVGGLSADQAKTRIAAAIDDARNAPITINAEGRTLHVSPKTAGLALEGASAVDRRTGFTLAPTTVLTRLFGSGDHVPFALKADKDQLTTTLDDAGAGLSGAPQNGEVAFRNGAAAVVKKPVDGRGLDTTALAGQITREWPRRTAYTAEVIHRAPLIDQKAVDGFLNGFGSTAVSGSVTATAGDHEAVISAAQIARVLKVDNVRGSLTPVVDAKAYAALMKELEPTLSDPPSNGKVVVAADGKKTYTAPAAGRAAAPKGSERAFLGAVGSADKRSFAVNTTSAPAALTLAQLKALRLSQVSTFDTFLPGGPANAARTKNIKIALGKVNGLVVGKGEQFSLLGALGTLTKKDGYVDAPTIQNGVEKPGLGGGLSQVSTTIYNAAFFAGVQIDEHVPHAFWISRYPMGREATLWEGAIDNRWTNDTDGPIVIQAGVVTDATGTEQVRVRFLGVPTYTVQSTTSDKFNLEAPKSQVISDPHCIEQPPVYGFDVVVTRVVKRGATVVRDEHIKTHYQAADRVICAR